MKIVSLVENSLVVCAAVFLILTLSSPSFSDCESPCSGAQDCLDPHCKGCDTGFGACLDCCSVETSVECGDYPGCHWAQFNGWGQCQNESGVSCDGVAEVPEKSRAWLLVAFLLAGFGLTAARRLKKKPI